MVVWEGGCVGGIEQYSDVGGVGRRGEGNEVGR